MTQELATPCVMGVRKPTILLPEDLGTAGSQDDLVAVLAHEIQHLRGADLTWNLVLRCAGGLLWFHPLAWRVRAAHAGRLRLGVRCRWARMFVGDVGTYCRTLARMALRAALPLPAAGLAMARRSSTRQRIEALYLRLHSAALAARCHPPGNCRGIGLRNASGHHFADAGRGSCARSRQNLAPSRSQKHSATKRLKRGSRSQAWFKPTKVGRSRSHRAGAFRRSAHGHEFVLSHLLCRLRQARGDGRPTGRSRSHRWIRHWCFQLLVIADGYAPTFLKKVDPAKAEKLEAKLTARTIPDDPKRVVRGIVLNPNGKPAVEPW